MLAGVMNGSALLVVNTNSSDTSIFNATTSKTGISAGYEFTHGVTCMVRQPLCFVYVHLIGSCASIDPVPRPEDVFAIFPIV